MEGEDELGGEGEYIDRDETRGYKGREKDGGDGERNVDK